MKKKSRWIVAIGLVLALMLMLAPTQVMAEPDGAVNPDGPYYPAAGNPFYSVYINIDSVTDLSAGQFYILYDKTVLTYVGAQCPKQMMTPYGFWPVTSSPSVSSDDSPADGTKIVFYDGGGNGYDGSGTIVEIWFSVPGATCDSTVLDLSTHATDFNGLSDSNSLPIASTWADGFLEVDGPCAVEPCAPPPTVVSGIAVPGAPGSEGPWVPAGYEPCDEFQPCEMLYIWGEGDPCHFCQWYRIWIQPYGPYGDMPDPSVVDGQQLLESLCPPGFPPEGIWVDVHVGEDGKFGPVAIWHVDGEYCELWEIVADKLDAGTVGVYDCEWDGLDAACVGEWGFHIYPEGLTIILVSLGLVAVGGYILVVRRRRGAETDLDL